MMGSLLSKRIPRSNHDTFWLRFLLVRRPRGFVSLLIESLQQTRYVSFVVYDACTTYFCRQPKWMKLFGYFAYSHTYTLVYSRVSTRNEQIFVKTSRGGTWFRLGFEENKDFDRSVFFLFWKRRRRAVWDNRNILIKRERFARRSPGIQTTLRYVEVEEKREVTLSLSLSPGESSLFLQLYVSFGETRAAGKSGFIFFLEA